MALAFKCVHNLPPHLYVSALPDITQKLKTFLLVNSVSHSEKKLFLCVWNGSEKSRLCGWITV